MFLNNILKGTILFFTLSALLYGTTEVFPKTQYDGEEAALSSIMMDVD